MTEVSGTLRDAQGNAIANASVVAQYKKSIVGYNGGAVVSNERLFTSDGSGVLTMPDLTPGAYDLFVWISENYNTDQTLKQKTPITVLDQEYQTLESAIVETIGNITPTVLQQAIDAKDAAESAASTASAALGDFGTRYLGARASDPSTDNEGNALTAGVLYYDTTNAALKAYNGASWVDYVGQASASASAALASENNAAASESAASTSENNAASSASAALTSENNAASSASAALTSENNAASSASAASTSENNAAASLDAFEVLYLGEKASDPATDNNGDPLDVGALYFNTTSNEMRVFDGGAWQAAYVSLAGALLASNNLSDLNSASTARSNLGLGSAATTASSAYATAAQGGKADTALQPADLVTQSTATWEAGTSTTEGVVSPAKNKAAFDAFEKQIGVGQTLQDMTASRAYDGTVYQNTTGKPIWIAVNEGSRSGDHLEVSSDNSTWISTGFGDGGARVTRYAIVPDGWYYRYGVISDLNAFWTELR